jgi:hypothetical protein
MRKYELPSLYSPLDHLAYSDWELIVKQRITHEDLRNICITLALKILLRDKKKLEQ